MGGGGVTYQRELECLTSLATHAWGGGRVGQRVEGVLEGNERTGDTGAACGAEHEGDLLRSVAP